MQINKHKANYSVGIWTEDMRMERNTNQQKTLKLHGLALVFNKNKIHCLSLLRKT